MSTTIESLELQIQSDSSSASSGIDALTSSLTRLRGALGGKLGLTRVANQMRKLNEASQGFDGTTGAKIESIANGMNALSQVRVPSSIARQLQNIKNAITGLSNDDFARIERLGTSLAPLNDVGRGNGLRSMMRQLSNLPALAQSLNTINWGQFEGQIRRLASSLAPLETRLNRVSVAFSRLPSRIRSLVNVTDRLRHSNNRAARSYINLWAKGNVFLSVANVMGRYIGSWIEKSNEYVENLNLFNASMGKYSEQAMKYAEQVEAAMGIDPSEWMRHQGVFMTITEGFGIVSDKAFIMSKNLTQLSYDLSSFFNISYNDAMKKLTSGISGELEPLRRLGYDLSQARLKAIALSLGIEKAFNKMTQAEKAQLRYYAIMTQVTKAQGDMARTLYAPANQLRILRAQVNMTARALGNVFIPVLNAILPYAIAVVKVIRLLAEALAKLMKFELPEVDYSGIKAGSSAVGDMADNFGDAAKNAKKLRDYTLGIDELNIISEDKDEGKNDLAKNGIGGDLGFKLPEYKFIDEKLKNRVDEIVDKMKAKLEGLLPVIASIGAGFAAWKIATGLTKGLGLLSTFLGRLKGSIGGISFGSLGILGFLSDMGMFQKFFKEFQEEGPTFRNVGGMLSEFAGMVGNALLVLGQTKVGGALIAVRGIGEIVIAVKGMVDNGVNWDDAMLALRGLSGLAIGIGIFYGGAKGIAFASIGFAIQGMIGVVDEIKNIIEAIKTGDWSEVNWFNLVVNALLMLGGIVVAMSNFNKIKSAANISNTATEITSVGTTITDSMSATQSINDAMGGKRGGISKMKSLVKNLGLGVVVIAEVVAAALILVGGIALLGKELKKVGDAWKPVIDNGKTTAKATGIGAVILAAIGTAIALIGKNGKPLATNIGVGTAVLAEIGLATGLFIVEIWAIGKGLQEIEKAWRPVLDNGKTVKKAIITGTGFLVAIGTATWGLGTVTTATGGTIPIAIGVGTALLVELAGAFILFVESLKSVARELSSLDEPLKDLNSKLPTLSVNMSKFVDFMTDFADEVVRYTEASVVAGLSATIDSIIDFFTDDPVDKLARDVGKINGQVKELNDKLKVAVPELKKARDLLKKYKSFLKEIEDLTKSNPDLSQGTFVSMKDVGAKIVTGFVEGIKSKSQDFKNAAKDIIDGFIGAIEDKQDDIKTCITEWANNVKSYFISDSNGGVNRLTWEKYSKEVTEGFGRGISVYSLKTKSKITTWASDVKKWFSQNADGGINKETWSEYAEDIITGFNSQITSKQSLTKSKITTWANDIKKWFEDKSSGAVNSETWKNFGEAIVKGFKTGVKDNYSISESVLKSWGRNTSSWFKYPNADGVSIEDKFRQIGNDVVQGFINGVDGKIESAQKKVQELAKLVKDVTKDSLQIHSPSRVFMGIGKFTVEGFNLGIESKMNSSYKLMNNWTEGVKSYQPKLAFAVDTSSLDNFSPSKIYTQGVSAEVQSRWQVSSDNMMDGMKEFYREYVEPTLREIASDTKRQADKEEQTIVQIGGKSITDAVETQKRANGYSFT